MSHVKMSHVKTEIRILAIDDDRLILNGYDHLYRSAAAGGALGDLLALDSRVDHAERSGGDDSVSRLKQQAQFFCDTAISGEQGLEMIAAAQQAGTPYTLLYLDMRMPAGISGMETAERAKQLDPDLHVVVISANSDCFSDPRWSKLGRRFSYLRKPYMREELLQHTLMQADYRACRLALEAVG